MRLTHPTQGRSRLLCTNRTNRAGLLMSVDRSSRRIACASRRLKRRAAAPLGCTAVARPDSRTLSPWDPILFHHTAILWARLRGVLAAGRPDGDSTTTFG